MSEHWKVSIRWGLQWVCWAPDRRRKRVVMSHFHQHHKSVAVQGTSLNPMAIGRFFYFSPSFHLPCCGLAPRHCLAPLHAHSHQAGWILQEIISSEATLTPQTQRLLLMVHPRRGFSGTAETGRLMVCGTPLCQIPGESSSYFEFPLFI